MKFLQVALMSWPGNIPERSHSHTLVSPTVPGCLGDASPGADRATRRSHTERGADATEAAGCVLQGAPVTGSVCRWEAGVGLQPGGCSGGASGEGKATVTLAQPRSSAGWWGLWVLNPQGWGFHSQRCPDGVLVPVSTSKGFPGTPITSVLT